MKIHIEDDMIEEDHVIKIETDINLLSQEDILFDSISIHFSVSIFFKQFLIHMTAPFLIFLGNPVNQGFLSLDGVSIFVNFLIVPVFYLMIVSAFFCKKEILQGNGAFWIPLLFAVLRKLQIGIKYASLSPTEYIRFMSASYETSQKYQTQLQLLTGWLPRPSELMEYEISAAAMRSGIDIHNMHFVVPNPKTDRDNLSQFRNWRSLLLGKNFVKDSDVCGDMILQPDGTYHVSAFRACISILRYSDKRDVLVEKIVYYGIVLLSFLNASIPIILIQDSKHMSIFAILFYISSTIINLIFCPIILSFLNIAVYDAVRGKRAFRYIAKMLRTTDFEPDKRIVRIGPTVTKVADIHHSRREADSIHRFIGKVTSRRGTSLSTSVSTKESESLSGNRKRVDSRMLDPHRDDVGFIYVSENDFAYAPRVHIKHDSNILVWTYSRLMLQNFGHRFLFRLDVFVGIITVLVFIYVIFGLVLAFAANDPSLYQTPFFLQTILILIIVLFSLIMMSFEGSRWNDELDRHKGALSAHMLKIMSRDLKISTLLNEIQSKCEDKDEGVVKLIELRKELLYRISVLEKCISIIDTNNKMKPFVLLGIPASPALTSTLIGASATFFGAVFTIYKTTNHII